jgi:alanyl-tRNA synthetase
LTQRLGIRSGDFDQQLQKAEQLRQRQNDLENEMKRLRMQLVSGAPQAADEEMTVDGIRVLAREVPFAPANELRDMADSLRSKLGSGVVVIGARADGNVSLVAAVSKDLTGRVRAGDLVKKLSAMVGGGGGGRPDFAQAGGKEPEKLPAALAAVQDAVREQLAR